MCLRVPLSRREAHQTEKCRGKVGLQPRLGDSEPSEETHGFRVPGQALHLLGGRGKQGVAEISESAEVRSETRDRRAHSL